jgi:hypothetical protein
MKKLLTITFSIFFAYIAIDAQSVSVNTDGSTADASSILDIKSTTKGMLVPRMTTAQRTTIIAPAIGLLVYDTDVKSFWYYNGSTWTNITGGGSSAGGSFTLPFEANVNTSGTAFKIANGTTAIEGSSVSNSAISGYSENGSGLSGNSTNGFGILATSTHATAIRAYSSNQNPTIYATNSFGGAAIEGNSNTYFGVSGKSAGNGLSGVYGTSTNSTGVGVWGEHTVGTGVVGTSSNGIGVSAISNASNGTALKASSYSGTALDVNGKVKIAGGNTNPGTGKVLTSDASGNATWKGPIAFRVTDLAYETAPDDMYLRPLFSYESYDLGNAFDLATSSFTVPEKGLYHFDVTIGWKFGEYSNARMYLIRERNGVPTKIAFNHFDFTYEYIWDGYEAPVVNQISTTLLLEPGDKIYSEIYQHNFSKETRKLVTYNCYFNGHLISRL